MLLAPGSLAACRLMSTGWDACWLNAFPMRLVGWSNNARWIIRTAFFNKNALFGCPINTSSGHQNIFYSL